MLQNTNYNGLSFTTTTSYFEPLAEAFITKNKNRLKQHGSNVYLKNNDNFEIELFNPRTTNVLCKIKINGSYLPGGGLVIKPGQRYFLDRHIDVARKFVFSTYEINGNDSRAVAAAASNGLVEIEFYDELNKPTPPPHTITINGTGAADWHSFYTNSISGAGTVCCDGMSNTYGGESFSFSGGVNGVLRSNGPVRLGTSKLSRSIVSQKSLETGRVEQGGASDQKFTLVDMSFQNYSFHTITWQIKPESVKPVETEDLKIYCTSCGKKLKSNHKFCSSCGTKVGD